MATYYKSRTYMYKRYLVEKKSMEEIAAENGVTKMTIFNWLVKFGYVKNTKAVR